MRRHGCEPSQSALKYSSIQDDYGFEIKAYRICCFDKYSSPIYIKTDKNFEMYVLLSALWIITRSLKSHISHINNNVIWIGNSRCIRPISHNSCVVHVNWLYDVFHLLICCLFFLLFQIWSIILIVSCNRKSNYISRSIRHFINLLCAGLCVYIKCLYVLTFLN